MKRECSLAHPPQCARCELPLCIAQNEAPASNCLLPARLARGGRALGPAAAAGCALAIMLPVALMLLPISSGSPAPQQQPSDLSLAQRLSALNFNHLGTVSSGQRFEYLSVCSSIQGNASFVPCSPMTNGAGCVGGYLFDVGRNGTREDTPPIGMRSANPLGGFGTGFFRLAADGSVRDWELDNSVAGATTITPTRPEMLLGVRVNGRAATLRTHPITPEGAAAPLPGVATLRYSASHPVTRLQIQDAVLGELNATLYAYTPFKMWNASASGVPAVALTLVAQNPRGSAKAVALDFMLTSPTFSERGIARTCTPVGSCANECKPSSTVRTHTAPTAKACKALCAKDSDCASWTLNRTICTISSAIERTVAQQEGMWSGTAGQWLQSSTPSGAPVLIARRPSIPNVAGPNYDAGDLVRKPQ